MSYEDGWAAIHLDMPGRVPRFEPSADYYHFDLIEAVTGIKVTNDTPSEERLKAAHTFVRAWDYGIYFGCAIGNNVYNGKFTRMGHAEYAVDGRDFDTRISSPFKSPEEVLDFDPWEMYGEQDEDALVKLANDQYHRQCELFPTTVNTTGVYTTLMSAMIAIFGWELLLAAAAMDQRRFGEVVNRYAKWSQPHYNAIARSDAVAIYSHDDLVWTEGPFLRPDWYREFIFPNLKKLWAPLVDAGKKICFLCDGNYTQFVDDVAACGNHGFWFEIFTDLDYVTEKYGRTHFIIGNADCRILTFGTKADVRAEVERCMAVGKKCPGYFMCVSGHIPPNVPVENALYYDEVYRELRRR